MAGLTFPATPAKVIAMPQDFPTFCHIGDYGPEVYHRIESLVALSDPLILWSPSAVLLKRYNCPIKPDRLLRLVDSGHVKIAGRRAWLTDFSTRKHSQWEGAPWTPGIDDLLRDMALRDENYPDKRVILLDPGTGLEKAEEVLHGNQQLKAAISEIIGRGYAPPGTLRKAREAETEPERVVLKDAMNHAEAVSQVGAKVPYLQPAEASFIGLMEIASDPSLRKRARATHASGELDRLTIRTIEETVDLLNLLEPLNRNGHLEHFLKSQGRAELVRFIRRIVERQLEVGTGDPIQTLIEDIEAHPLKNSILSGDPIEKFAIAGGLGLALLDAKMHTNFLSIAGLIAAAHPVGKGLLRKVGLTRPGYDGPLWPFLWNSGNRPRTQDVNALLERLEEMKSRILYGDPIAPS